MAKQKTKGGVISGLENSLEDFFLKKLPGIPSSIKELMVKYGPWLVLVLLVICIPGFGILLSVPGNWGYGFSWWIVMAGIVLEAVAIPGLFKRKMSSWRLMYYSALLMVVYNLLIVNLYSLIIGTVVPLYILFQIKSYYK